MAKKSGATKDAELESGYTLEQGTPYHFEHISKADAEQLAMVRELPYVVETINWTYAGKSKKQVHHNKYFAVSLTDAIGLAARIEMMTQVVAEEVVCIRPAADEEEWNMMRRAFDHYSGLVPPAVATLNGDGGRGRKAQ